MKEVIYAYNRLRDTQFIENPVVMGVGEFGIVNFVIKLVLFIMNFIIWVSECHRFRLPHVNVELYSFSEPRCWLLVYTPKWRASS